MQSKFSGTTEGRYAHTCLSSKGWWENIEAITTQAMSMVVYVYIGHAEFEETCVVFGWSVLLLCEQNWSTLASIHTKIRNKLTHNKLNKLVYVNYNLGLQIQQTNAQVRKDDDNPLQRPADLSFYDTNNQISDMVNEC